MNEGHILLWYLNDEPKGTERFETDLGLLERLKDLWRVHGDSISFCIKHREPIIKC